jgi:hypothetical protein
MAFSPTQSKIITPLHGVKDRELLAELVASMSAHGWRGRPLIVYKDDENHYQALTGSHRLVAAAKTGTRVPIRVLTKKELAVLTESPWWNRYGIINALDAVVALREAGMTKLAKLWSYDDQ